MVKHRYHFSKSFFLGGGAGHFWIIGGLAGGAGGNCGFPSKSRRHHAAALVRDYGKFVLTMMTKVSFLLS